MEVVKQMSANNNRQSEERTVTPTLEMSDGYVEKRLLHGSYVEDALVAQPCWVLVEVCGSRDAEPKSWGAMVGARCMGRRGVD